MSSKNISILLLGEHNFDSRVKRISAYLSSVFDGVSLISLDRGSDGGSKASSFEHNLKAHLIIRLATERLPRGGKWGYLKYLEAFVRFFILGFNSQVIYCNDLNTLPIGFLIKVFRPKTKLIYDTHELAPYQGAKSRFKIRLRRRFEGFFIGKADYVLTVSDKIALWYQRSYKLKYVYPVLNTPNIADVGVGSSGDDTVGDGIRFNKFVWHGIFGYHRGIEAVLDVFAESSDLNITFYGWGDLEGMIRDFAGKYDNIQLKPPIAQDELIQQLKSYDAGLFTYMSRSKNYDWALPNKFFEYSAASLPIISFPLSQAKSTIKSFNLGLVCTKFEAGSLKNELVKFSKSDVREVAGYKDGVRRFLSENSWDIQRAKLDNIFSEIESIRC